MILILIFGMTMQRFAWVYMDSLRRRIILFSGFITQRLRKIIFFTKKNAFFLDVMQAVFDYAN
jgi:hypothetical protein